MDRLMVIHPGFSPAATCADLSKVFKISPPLQLVLSVSKGLCGKFFYN